MNDSRKHLSILNIHADRFFSVVFILFHSERIAEHVRSDSGGVFGLYSGCSIPGRADYAHVAQRDHGAFHKQWQPQLNGIC